MASSLTPPVPELEKRTPIQSRHSCGAARYDAPTISAVVPSATARERHSRRSGNQSRPTPGVTLVRSTNAQLAG